MRRSRRLLPLLAALLAVAPTFGPRELAAEEYNPFAGREAATPAADRLIVRLRAESGAGARKPDLDGTRAAQRLSGVGLRTGLRMKTLRSLGAGMDVVHVEVASGESLDTGLARLRADPEVEFAEPDARMRPHRLPNDPAFPEQWFLQETVPGDNGPTASAIDAVSAWDATVGSPDVVVAVIDSGVRFEHPDLQRVANGGKLLPGYDFVGRDSNGSARTANDGDGWDPDPSDPGDWVSAQDRSSAIFSDCPVEDSSWHGTRVSGILAGLTDNSLGIAGVGWANTILPVRVLGKCGGATSDIIAGMRWAAGLAVPGAPANATPARVLNLSLGGQGDCSRAYQEAVDEITARGVVVVVSAGNDGSLVDQPGNCRGVVDVTAVRHVGTKVGFANLGPDVTIAAPGGNCVNIGIGDACLYSLDTTTDLGLTTPNQSGYTDRLGNINVGTSFSAPIVAGIAALMFSVNRQLTPEELAGRLQESARPFPVSSDRTVPTCRVPAHPDEQQLSECNCTTATCGAGLAHAPGAVAAALRPIARVSGPTAVDPGQTVNLSGRGSVGADGRTVSSHAWTLVRGSTSLSAASGSETSFVAPGTSGEVVVRLTVTDDAGRSDSVDVNVRVGNPTPPPPGFGSGGSGGGGGSPDLPTLALLVLVAGLAALRRRFGHSR